MQPLNLQLKLTGLSGNVYSFQLFQFGHIQRPFKAIYVVGKIVFNERRERKFSTLYIGKTCDIESRFGSHHKDREFAQHGANIIGIFEVDNPDERDQIEKDLIPSCNPPCNEMLTR